jgi:predicted GNAT family acetyltransferase
MDTNYKLVHNKAKHQYEYHIDGHLARVVYEEKSGVLHLTETHVPKKLAGRGIAAALVKDVLEEIEKRSLKMRPGCPYIVKYVEKHPEYKKLL